MLLVRATENSNVQTESLAEMQGRCGVVRLSLKPEFVDSKFLGTEYLRG